MPMCSAVPNAVGGGLAGWQRDLAVRHLIANLAHDFPVQQLAMACGLSRSHFTRAFKISTGLPPHHWLMHHRVSRAQQMLAGAKDSIAEIALSCGFSDQSHLTRVFRAQVGASPGAWRRHRQAEINGAAASPR